MHNSTPAPELAVPKRKLCELLDAHPGQVVEKARRRGYRVWLEWPDGTTPDQIILLGELIERFSLIDRILGEEYFRGRHSRHGRTVELRRVDSPPTLSLYMPGVQSWKVAKTRADDFLDALRGALEAIDTETIALIWTIVDPSLPPVATRMAQVAREDHMGVLEGLPRD